MKILLVSDSHGNNEILDELVKRYPNMDLYLHLGDSESTPELIHPFVTVRGNCDYFSNAEETFMINTEVGYLFACHKLESISKEFLKNNNVKIVCFGHTHKRKFENKENILYINPGSLSYSRDGYDLSYATIEITKSGVKHAFDIFK